MLKRISLSYSITGLDVVKKKKKKTSLYVTCKARVWFLYLIIIKYM
jgi:hypothetical protein